MANVPNEIDQELEAIRALLAALTPLSPEARVNAVDYALRRLDIQLPRRSGATPVLPISEVDRPPAPPAAGTLPKDIRSLTEQKRPRSAIEMAALVAYYLSEIQDGNERKETVTTEDLRRYFKQANFPLPGAIQYTLGNASAAGFFESAGRGEYKLTAVGHNLVAHVLPASDDPAPRPRRTRKTTSTTRKTSTSKKTSAVKKVPGKKSAQSKAPPKTR